MNKKVIVGIAIILIVGIIAIIGISHKDRYVVEENKIYNHEYFALYSEDGTVGVIKKDSTVVIQPKYFDIYIPNPEEDVFICYTDENEYIIINSKGEELYKEFSIVDAFKTSDGEMNFEKNVLRVEKDGKYGAIDFKGNVIIEPEYDFVESLMYKPGKLLVQKDGKCGVFDEKGNKILDLSYDSIEGDGYGSDELGYTRTGYILKNKGTSGTEYGYANVNGKVILKTEYENVERILNYKDNMNVYLTVMQNGKKGVFKNSKKIIGYDYQKITYSEDANVLIAKTTKNNDFYNFDGRKIFDFKCQEYTITGKYICISSDDGVKVYDSNGNFVTNQNYKKIEATENSDYIITVDNNNYYSIMNKGTVIKDHYINLKYAYNDYFIFTTEENKVGVLNVWNGVVVPGEYDCILKIDKLNCLEAKKNDETTIFSEKMEKISTMNGMIVENFNDNYGIAYSQNDRIYFDKSGKIVSNKELYKDNNLFAINKEGKWGFCNKAGNIVINCEYDMVTEINKYGFAGVRKNGKWGVINKDGKIILQPEYEIETYYMPIFIGESYVEQTDNIFCVKLQ